MPAARLTMRKTREILRLRLSLKRTHREIAEACKVSPSTVGDCLARFRASGLDWPLPEDLDDSEIAARLYPAERDSTAASEASRPEPDWSYVHQELRRKHVTLALIWEEYKRSHLDGYQYSWFCRTYRAWAGKLDLVMRQHHAWGEKCFVDYIGTTMPVVDQVTRVVREAQVFIGVLGASNYTYAEATWTQGLSDWIGSHVRMLAFFGGSPAVLVPDNLKSGVTKADHFDPDVNPTYQEMADHYGIAVIPARKRRPKDKAKAEVGVQIAERWILARLRNRTLFTLEELNEAISELLDELNARPFQKLPGTRSLAFETDEKPRLQELPAQPYRFGTWCKGRVGPDYHVQVEEHYYSIPFTLVGETVDIRVSGQVVEIVHQGRRVFTHRRSFDRFASTTIPEHMPSHHRQKAEWTPERIAAWAQKTGPAVEEMTHRLMSACQHPEQAFRACFGLLTLGRRYGGQRLEAACQRAIAVHAYRYKSVKAILDKGLDGVPLPNTSTARSAGHHENVRGADYYREAALPATSATCTSDERN